MAEKKTSNGSKNSTGKSSSAKKSASGKKKSSGRSSTKTNVNRIVKAAKKYDTDKSFKDNQDAVLDVISATATSAKRASNKKQKKIFTVLAVIMVIAFIGISIYCYLGGWMNTLIYGKDGYIASASQNVDYDAAVIKQNDLSVHFLELGNKYVGDSVYIKAGDTDVLIDAGSRNSSSAIITQYVNQYVTDGKLEYVIATHAHQDHIAGFVGTKEATGIFEAFDIGTIIDFPLTNLKETTEKGGKTLYGNYLEKREKAVANGAKRYSALSCYNNQGDARRIYKLSDTVELEILYNYFYDHSSKDENNYSVTVMLHQYANDYDFASPDSAENDGKVNHYFFSGDLEKEGEEKLIEYYSNSNGHDALPHCVLYKAGHHGSKTSSTKALMAALSPEYVCVCCCAGTGEYTKANENQFPTQQFVDNVAPYTDRVYVTTVVDFYADTGWSTRGTVKSMNGNIVIACDSADIKTIKTSFTNNGDKLKDTDWFKQHRVCPKEWKQEQ